MNLANLKPNHQRAKFLVIFIWIVFALEILTLLSGIMQYSMLKNFEAGVEISDETLALSDIREGSLGVIYFTFFVASGIAFIRWFRRAYFNLHQINNNLLYSDVWAASGWFIPILSFIRPYQIMKELYHHTQKELISQNLITRNQLSDRFLGIWWTLWIMNTIAGQVQFRLSNHAKDVSSMIGATSIGIIGSAVGIPLALITIKVIKDYANVEGKLTELKQEEEPEVLEAPSNIEITQVD